jgi:hypothetical protein
MSEEKKTFCNTCTEFDCVECPISAKGKIDFGDMSKKTLRQMDDYKRGYDAGYMQALQDVLTETKDKMQTLNR